MQGIMSIYIVRDEPKQKIIKFNETNFFQIRFVLEHELKKINTELKKYKKRGIIRTLKKQPAIYNPKYHERISQLVYSRRTIKSALNLMHEKRSI